MKEKVIGILGGMGPEATLDLFEKIIRQTPAEHDQDHLRILIDDNPKIPDRTQAILNHGENPVPMMIESGRSLIEAGADFIIVPCITAHLFLNKISPKLNRPILSAFDAVSNKITNDHPEIKAIGLLATKGTIRGGVFQERLLESGIFTQVPEDHDQEQVMSAIYKIKGDPEGLTRHENKAVLKKVSGHLIEKGSQGIIGGCTEIPLVLSPEDLPVPFFNPLSILAEAAIKEAKQ